jgi:hypothetical protein
MTYILGEYITREEETNTQITTKNDHRQAHHSPPPYQTQTLDPPPHQT